MTTLCSGIVVTLYSRFQYDTTFQEAKLCTVGLHTTVINTDTEHRDVQLPTVLLSSLPTKGCGQDSKQSIIRTVNLTL